MTITTTLREPYPDVPLTLREAGAGAPLFVTHGAGGPATVTPFLEHYAPTRHVLAPTHPGWDDTPRPEWFTGIDSLVETYLDLLDDLDLRDVVLVGSSLGGWIAAEMAVRDRAARVSRLVLLGAVGPHIDGIELFGPGRDGPRTGPPPALAATMRAYAGPTMGDRTLLPRLRRVRIPALLLRGADDPFVPPAYGRAYAEALGDATFDTIPDAGHLPVQDQPERTLARIDAFLLTG